MGHPVTRAAGRERKSGAQTPSEKQKIFYILLQANQIIMNPRIIYGIFF
jgi:hypothetical protein